MQKIKEAISKIDLSRFYVYLQELNLTGRDSEVQNSFTLNDNQFYMIAPYITLTDSNGLPLESGVNRHNEMRIDIINDQDQKYFESPVTVQALNRVHKNERYAGALLNAEHRYTVKLNGTNHPEKDINKFPVKGEFHMIGYTLPSIPSEYTIERVTSRIRPERPYTTDKKFNITSPSDTVEEKITVGNDENYIVDASITMTDSEGRDILLSDTITDSFTIEMRSSDEQVMFRGMNIRAFNALWQSKQWKGIVLKKTTSYWISINGKQAASAFPADIATLKFDAKTANFTIGDTVTGGTSSATGIIAGIVENGATGTLILTDITGTFVDNETVAGAITGSATSDGVIAAGACLYPLKAQLSLQGYKLER